MIKRGARRESFAHSKLNGINYMFQIRTIGLREQDAIAKNLKPIALSKTDYQNLAGMEPSSVAGKLMHKHRPSRKNARKMHV